MIFRKYKKTLSLLLAAAGMAGCVQEYGGGEITAPENGNDVTVTVRIPGQQTPLTRSIDGAGEAAVKSIDLLVFDNSGNLTEHAEGQSIIPVAGDPQYKVTFKAMLTNDANARTVVIIANASDEVSAVVNEGSPQSAYGKSKTEVLESLVFASENDASIGWKWNAGDPYTPIPMYGEVAVSGIENGMKIEGIDLTRMLARVDVVNSAAAQFTLTDVYVVNYNTKGYLEPKWDVDDKPILNIPVAPGKQTGETNAMVYSDQGGITALTGEIYTYEAVATSGIEGAATHTDAVCLIVKGTWTADGGEYYYRIDFTAGNAGLAPHEVQYMPVYRNHIYTFDITEVNGRGFADFDSALNSLGVLNNLRTELHTVDMSGIKDMIFNGQHYIGVDHMEFTLSDQATTGIELVVITNAEDFNALASVSWIKNLDISNVETISGGDYKYTITFDIEANSDFDERTGKITLTAGRLNLDIVVTQDGFQLRGGSADILYFAADGTLQAGKIGTDFDRQQMAFFKFGSVVGFTNNNDAWAISHIKFNPMTNQSAITSYADIPRYTWDNNTSEGHISSMNYHNGANVRLGKGDPCMLIGKKVEQIAAMSDEEIDDYRSGWRLPTAKDNADFVGAPTSYYNTRNLISQSTEDFNFWGDIPAGIPKTHIGARGGWFPVPGDRESVIGRSLRNTDHSGFMPAAGNRDTYGNANLVGGFGDYWSSTVSNGMYGCNLAFGATLVYPCTNNAYYDKGFGIRCVRAR